MDAPSTILSLDLGVPEQGSKGHSDQPEGGLMSVSAINSLPTIQWLQQLLSGAQSAAMPQSCSSSTSASSDSTRISQEAIQLNATQATQAQTTGQPSTVKAGHHR